LTNGIDYTFQIAASNAIGVGSYSQFRTVQPGNKPYPIDTFTYTSTVTDTILDWIPGSNGGATIKWYILKAYQIYSGASVAKSLYGTTTTYSLSGSSVLYDCFLTAINDPGYSPTFYYYQSILRLSADSYSGTGTWSNTSLYGDTVTGATLSQGTIAKNQAGNGIVFDGATVWSFPTPDALMVSYSHYTVHLWYKETAIPTTYPTIVAQQFGPGGYQVGNLVNIEYVYNSHAIEVGAFAGGFAFINTGTVTTNTWSLYSFTIGNGYIYGYKNGTLFGDQGGPNAVNTSNPIYIGGDAGGGYIQGEVGEVSIYNVVMNPAAIQNYFNYTRGTYGV